MVQAAAQAQAVVAAAKNRGGGLVPMNAAQISALSQIQAQAIVNARPQTAIVGSGQGKADDKPSPQQIQNQIQLQAQALVHAHTQAQIGAGIYKGGDAAPAATTAAVKPKGPAQPAPLPPPTAAPVPPKAHPHPLPARQQPAANQSKPNPFTAPRAGPPRPPPPCAPLPQGAALVPLMAPIAAQASSTPAVHQTNYMTMSACAGTIAPSGPAGVPDDGLGGVVMLPTSPEFLAKLDGALTAFWAGQLQEMRELGTDRVQTEQDFKNHNDLPLARIKRIMKSDEDVRMISAEAPVLFAKACEMFILEMTLRSWNYSENNKRKTLQKEDVKEAIQRTDILDFLVDVIH